MLWGTEGSDKSVRGLSIMIDSSLPSDDRLLHTNNKNKVPTCLKSSSSTHIKYQHVDNLYL